MHECMQPQDPTTHRDTSENECLQREVANSVERYFLQSIAENHGRTKHTATRGSRELMLTEIPNARVHHSQITHQIDGSRALLTVQHHQFNLAKVHWVTFGLK
jgi:hypothetical protein